MEMSKFYKSDKYIYDTNSFCSYHFTKLFKINFDKKNAFKLLCLPYQ